MRDEDNADHILVQCVYAREVWHTGFDLLHTNVIITEMADTFAGWWLRARAVFRGKDRRGFDSLVIETAWAPWRQRNARVFYRPEQFKSPADLAKQILDELKDWDRVGVGVGGLDRFVRS